MHAHNMMVNVGAGLCACPYMIDIVRTNPRTCPYVNWHVDMGNHRGVPLQRCHVLGLFSINRFHRMHEDIMCAL